MNVINHCRDLLKVLVSSGRRIISNIFHRRSRPTNLRRLLIFSDCSVSFLLSQFSVLAGSMRILTSCSAYLLISYCIHSMFLLNGWEYLQSVQRIFWSATAFIQCSCWTNENTHLLFSVFFDQLLHSFNVFVERMRILTLCLTYLLISYCIHSMFLLDRWGHSPPVQRIFWSATAFIQCSRWIDDDIHFLYSLFLDQLLHSFNVFVESMKILIFCSTYSLISYCICSK